jgi:transposase InsO family protein
MVVVDSGSANPVRLWRLLKYEEVYLKDYPSVAELESGLTSWFRFYNHERPHQSLEYRTPAEVYRGPGEACGEWRKAETLTKKSGSVV